MAEQMRGVTVSGTLGAAGASSSSVELDECAPIASCMLTSSTTLTASAVRSTFHAAAEAPRARSEREMRARRRAPIKPKVVAGQRDRSRNGVQVHLLGASRCGGGA